MTFAVMQPYFFPYIGYFALIAAAERWFVFDEAQYIQGGWIARNRILSSNGGWRYLTVPVKRHPTSARIREVKIAHDSWRWRLSRRLEHYSRAPHFEAAMGLLTDCFDDMPDTISELNVRCLERTCAYLGVPFAYELVSHLDLDLDAIETPTDWAWVIGRHTGGTHLVNLPGGRAFMVAEDFKTQGFGLEFISMRPHSYDQGHADFEPSLSIIDVLMFRSPEQIRGLLTHVDRHRVA